MEVSRQTGFRLENDRSYLQKTAIEVLNFWQKTFSNPWPAIEIACGVTEEDFLVWSKGERPVGILQAWKIIEKAGIDHVPVDWIGRSVWGDYDIKKRLPFLKTLTKEVAEKLKNGEDQHLFIEDGTLEIYSVGSYPGHFKILLHLLSIKEANQVIIYRLDEDNCQVAGMINLELPKEADVLTEVNLIDIIPSLDHHFTVEDCENLVSWVRSGTRVEEDFLQVMEEITFERMYGRTAKLV